MEEIKFKYEAEQKVNDPLKMLETSSSGEPNNVESHSTSSTSGSGQDRTERKDDVRINEAMSHTHEHANLITRKDLANLKRNQYHKVREQFKDSFVIKNKKTGQMVEIKAASSLHACNLIGWRMKNCTLIDVIKGEDKPQENTNNIVMAGTNEKEEKTQVENTDASANGSNTEQP